MTEAPRLGGAPEEKDKRMSITHMVPPMIRPDDTARTRKTDPLTSHAAADTNNVTDSQLFVLQCFNNGQQRAAFELEAIMAGLFSPSRIRTALRELQDQGRVGVVEGVLKRTPSGRNARVWKLTS